MFIRTFGNTYKTNESVLKMFSGHNLYQFVVHSRIGAHESNV